MKPHRVFLEHLREGIIGPARRAKLVWRITRARRFVRPSDIDCQSLLPPPPGTDSAQTQSELLDVLRLQEARSADEVQRAVDEAFISPTHFSQAIGDWFTWRNLPFTMSFLHDLMLADGAIVEPAKSFYARKRPYEIDPRVKPCVPLEQTASYPSGHAARTLIQAGVLGLIFPDKKEPLQAIADRIPQYRIKAGVHFASDIEAGKIIGAAIFAKMTQSRAFQTCLNRARAECREKRPNI